ncbi:MAG: FAD-dependent oxidoreductase [Clostridia bacterium]|nr:FAD-dependent oxidoreductase [Clostridia bacterium]
MYDIIIIGAGPAGLTAAIYAMRADKNILLLEKENFGGQITFSPKVENYPGFTSVSGSELAEQLLDQVMSYGAQIEMATATNVIDHGTHKTVVTDYGEFDAKTVIIATGSKHRHLGIDGELELIGNGISYCAVCDGAFYNGKAVAVIGGGNTALQEAVMLSEYCTSVTIIQNLSFMTGEGKLLKILEGKSNVKMVYDSVVTEFLANDTLYGVKVRNTKDGAISEITVDGVFVAIGQQPENEPFATLTALNDYGYIISDERCRTDTPGVFVAGDCRTKEVRQVTTATADGAVAALAACKFIDTL